MRFLQAWTEVRSKEWPEETITGSAMREPEMGQRNSSGGFWVLLGFEAMVVWDDLWKKSFFHFNLGVVLIGSENFSGDSLAPFGEAHFLCMFRWWTVSFTLC